MNQQYFSLLYTRLEFVVICLWRLYQQYADGNGTKRYYQIDVIRKNMINCVLYRTTLFISIDESRPIRHSALTVVLTSSHALSDWTGQPALKVHPPID